MEFREVSPILSGGLFRREMECDLLENIRITDDIEIGNRPTRYRM